jgi:hypothetical protein
MLLHDLTPGMHPRRVRIFLAEKGLSIPRREVDRPGRSGPRLRAGRPARRAGSRLLQPGRGRGGAGGRGGFRKACSNIGQSASAPSRRKAPVCPILARPTSPGFTTMTVDAAWGIAARASWHRTSRGSSRRCGQAISGDLQSETGDPQKKSGP